MSHAHDERLPVLRLLVPGLLVLALAACGGKGSTPAPSKVASSLASAPKALLVVGSATLGGGDLALNNRLATTLGYNVTVVTGAASKTADATGMALVVISESVVDTDVNTKFKTVTAPVIVLEPLLFDDMALTGTTLNTSFGTKPTQTQVAITNAGHLMAAGLAGNVTVATSGQIFGWGSPTATAEKIATVVGTAAQTVIFGYGRGAVMAQACVAMNRRVGWFASQAAMNAFNANGWALFDAAVGWATKPEVLLIAGSATLTAGETALKNRLQAAPFNMVMRVVVSPVDPVNAALANLIIISDTAAATVGTELGNVPVPIVTMNQAAYPTLQLTGSTLGTDYGTTANQTQVVIAAPTHPLAAGLTGTVTLTTTVQTFRWGATVAAGAVKVATIVGSPTRAAVFGYPAGALLKDGTPAGARRVGFWGQTAALAGTVPNANAWKLVDAAVTWAKDPTADARCDGKANGTACSDGNACTQTDTCQGGICVGANPKTCAAQDQCHVAGTCDPASGACTNPIATNGTTCNDANACTTADTCQAGSCTGGPPVICQAQDQCHVAGTCSPATGCSNPAAANGTSCNDSSLCTTGDTCQSGTCTGAPVVCQAQDICHVAGTCSAATGCSNPVSSSPSCAMGTYDDFNAPLAPQTWTISDGMPSTSGGLYHSDSRISPNGGSGIKSTEPFDGRSVAARDFRNIVGSGRCWFMGYADPDFRYGVVVRNDLNDDWVSADVQDHLFLHAWQDGKNTFIRDLGQYYPGSPPLDFIGKWLGQTLEVEVKEGGITVGHENVDTSGFMLGMRFWVGNYCGSEVSLGSLEAGPYVAPTFPEESTVAWSTFDEFNQPFSSQQWVSSSSGDVRTESNRLMLDATASGSNVDIYPSEVFDGRSVRITDIQEEPGSERCWHIGYMDPGKSGVILIRALTAPTVPESIETDVFLEVWNAGAVVTRRDLGPFGPGKSLDFTGVWTGSTLNVEIKKDHVPVRYETIANAPTGMQLRFQDYCGAKVSIERVEASPVLSPVASCTDRPDGLACEDSNACTVGGACVLGFCGLRKVCHALDQCHVAGVCDHTTGVCSDPIAEGQLCNDGNACTLLDVCSAQGVCTGSIGRDCNDGHICTTDLTCHPVLGCVNIPRDTCDQSADTCEERNATGEICEQLTSITIDASELGPGDFGLEAYRWVPGPGGGFKEVIWQTSLDRSVPQTLELRPDMTYQLWVAGTADYDLYFLVDNLGYLSFLETDQVKGNRTKLIKLEVPGFPRARLDWEMPEGFTGFPLLAANYNNGSPIYPPGPQADPTQVQHTDRTIWPVILDACGSTSPGNPIVNYHWDITFSSAYDQHLDSATCRHTFDFVQKDVLPNIGTYPARLTITTQDGRTSTVTRDIVLRDFLIVSIGDSIAAGEGAADVPRDHSALLAGSGWFDIPWYDRRCHRSIWSGPAQAALMLERADPHSSITFYSTACSGAQIVSGLESTFAGQEPDRRGPNDENPISPQLDQVAAAVGGRHIDALTVNIGANDVKFSDVIVACTASDCTGDDSVSGGAYSASIRVGIYELGLFGYSSLDANLRRLHVDSNAVFIAEYQNPFQVNSAHVCPGVTLVGAKGGFDGHIDEDDLQWGLDNLIYPLNEEVSAAARTHGWNFVGGIAQEFTGHSYCDLNNWVNRYDESVWSQGNPSGAFHPNRAGYEVFARHLANEIKKGHTGVGCDPPDACTPVYDAPAKQLPDFEAPLWRTARDGTSAQCPDDFAVAGLSCGGADCETIPIMCRRIAGGTGARSWLPSPLRPGDNTRACPAGSVLTGVSCTGAFCDVTRLECATVRSGHLTGCQWDATWLDEESTNTVFPYGSFATALDAKNENLLKACVSRWVR